jgi:hypothetical protein
MLQLDRVLLWLLVLTVLLTVGHALWQVLK